MILYHGIWLHNIRTNLISPSDICHLTADTGEFFLCLLQEAEEKLSGIRGEVTDIGWGNQIRSYVMQPYTMVKDHRTNEETGNVDAVLDGGIDIFINAYLKWIALKK